MSNLKLELLASRAGGSDTHISTSSARQAGGRWKSLMSLMLSAVLLAFVGLLAGCGDDGGGGDDDDMGEDMAMDADASEMEEDVEDEDMRIPPTSPLYGPVRVAFEYADPLAPADPIPMFVVTPEPGTDARSQSEMTQLTSQINCASGDCTVTPSLRYFIYNSGGALSVGEISDAPAINVGMLDEIATDVTDVQVAGNRIAYVSGNEVFYADFSGGLTTPQKIGDVDVMLPDGIEYTDGGVAIAERGDYALIYRIEANTSSLGVWKVNVNTMEESFVYRFGIARGAPSEFSADNPFVVASDGQTAVMMMRGLTLYNTCTSNAGCMELPGGSCRFYTNEAGVTSSTGLCGAEQVTLQTFDLEADDLGTECNDDSDCSFSHRCLVDPTSLLDQQRKVCGPAQLVLAPVAANSVTCDIKEEGQYADVLEKLRIMGDDRVVILGRNDCGELNISDNAVVAYDLDLDPESATVLEGDYDNDFGASFCYDEQEDTWDYAACALEIQDFEIGPDGGLILRASARNDQSGREIWAFDESGIKYPVTNDVIYDVADFFAVSLQ